MDTQSNHSRASRKAEYSKACKSTRIIDHGSSIDEASYFQKKLVQLGARRHQHAWAPFAFCRLPFIRLSLVFGLWSLAAAADAIKANRNANISYRCNILCWTSGPRIRGSRF